MRFKPHSITSALVLGKPRSGCLEEWGGLWFETLGHSALKTRVNTLMAKLLTMRPTEASKNNVR